MRIGPKHPRLGAGGFNSRSRCLSRTSSGVEYIAPAARSRAPVFNLSGKR